MAKISRFFTRNKNINELNPKELIDILNMKGTIKVIIHKNSLMAEELKKETLVHFRK